MVNKKNLTYEKRLGLLHFLLKQYQNGTLERGALARAADFLSVVPGTVSRLWNGWVLNGFSNKQSHLTENGM
jgi:hypothetical protein